HPHRTLADGSRAHWRFLSDYGYDLRSRYRNVQDCASANTQPNYETAFRWRAHPCPIHQPTGPRSAQYVSGCELHRQQRVQLSDGDGGYIPFGRPARPAQQNDQQQTRGQWEFQYSDDAQRLFFERVPVYGWKPEQGNESELQLELSPDTAFDGDLPSWIQP